MEQLNRKPLGFCLILLFGLMLFSTIIGIFTAFMISRFDIIDWHIHNNILNGTDALFKLLYLAAFIFTGINRKWFTNPIGQVSAFVLAALSLFDFFYILSYLFSPSLFSPITQTSINLSLSTLDVAGWAGLLLTIRTGLAVKIIGLIYKGIIFMTTITNVAISLSLYTDCLYNVPLNLLTIINGIITVTTLLFVPAIIICAIVWMCKKPAIN